MIRTSQGPIVGIAIDPHVHVIVVWIGIRRLTHDLDGPGQERRVVALRDTLLNQTRREITLDENPLHLGVGVPQQRPHEVPVSTDVESDIRDRPRG